MKKLLLLIPILLALFYAPLRGKVLDLHYQDGVIYYAYVDKEAKPFKNEILDWRTENSWTESKGTNPEDPNRILVTQTFYTKPQFKKVKNTWKQIEYKADKPLAFGIKTRGLALALVDTARALEGTMNVYSGNGDGYVKYTNAATWATAQGTADGTTADYTGLVVFTPYSGKTSGGLFDIYRGFFPFDTSSLPDGYTVSAARLKIFVSSKSNGDNDGDDWVNVVQTSQYSNYNLFIGDYDTCGSAIDNPTEGATRIDIGDISTGAYNTWTLTATGRSWISKTSWTRLGLREGHDAIDSAYAGSNETYNGLFIYTSNWPGSEMDPKLEVDYSPYVSWLAEYSARVNVFLNKDYLPPNTEGFPFEVIFPTTASSSAGTGNMSWIYSVMNTTTPYLRFVPTREDGLSKMYGEWENWNTSTYQGRLWVGGTALSTTSNQFTYIYYDPKHSTSTEYVSKIGEGLKGNQNVWDRFTYAFNFSATTSNSVSSDDFLSILGTETYSTDEKGFTDSAFLFDGATSLSGATPLSVTSTMFFTVFAAPLLDDGTYTIFEESRWLSPGNPLNDYYRLYYTPTATGDSLNLDCGGTTATSSLSLDNANWYHFTLYIDYPTGCYLYVNNGNLISTAWSPQDKGFPSFCLGAEGFACNLNYFTGKMGKFWERMGTGDDVNWYSADYRNFKNELLILKPNYKMMSY